MVVARSAAMSITVEDITVPAPEPSYGLAGGTVTPSGETSVKLSLVKKVLTGVPRVLAWAMSSCWSSCITGLLPAVAEWLAGVSVCGRYTSV